MLLPSTEVVSQITLANKRDIWRAERQQKKQLRIRTVTSDAIVSYRVEQLCLPPDVIKKLGLKRVARRKARTSQGIERVSIYGPVSLSLGDRFATVDAVELATTNQILLGWITLSTLQLQDDSNSQTLVDMPPDYAAWARNDD